MSRAFIIGGKRTPVGNFMGILHPFKGYELSALALIDTIKKFNLNHHHIEKIILGNAITVGQDQNPARQVALLSKTNKAVGYLLNNGSASGLIAINRARIDIIANQADFIIAGGFESLSNVPQIIKNSRPGTKYGDTECQDPISVDVLINPKLKVVQGFIAEQIAKHNKIDKDLQDEYAKLSYQRATDAYNMKKLEFEMSSIKLKPNDPPLADEIYQKFNPKQLEFSKPIYVKNTKKGSITNLNSSRFADGACVLAIASEGYCHRANIKPLAEILSCVTIAGDSIAIIDTIIECVNQAVMEADITNKMIGYWEIHEDYASTVLLFMKKLDIHYNKVNVHGGSIAIGNPFGMTSSRLILSMVNILRTYKETYGCVIIPHEDGSVSAAVVKNRS